MGVDVAGNASELSRENYSLLQQFVYRSSGIVLGEDKEYLLEARLMPVARRAKLSTINDLCTLIRQGIRNDINQQIVDAMTTNETLFFRDNAPFDTMRRTILPELIETRRIDRELKFWSAASSSGQEAYSLAMLLREQPLEDWKIQIFGTDLSESMVQRAREGRYMQIEVNRGLPGALLAKYFNRVEAEWQIKDELRRCVRFEQFDLRQAMTGFGPFDFVFCRNVLIYFDIETKKQILNRICERMNRGGYLILGAAETTLEITDVFERRVVDGMIFYRKP